MKPKTELKIINPVSVVLLGLFLLLSCWLANDHLKLQQRVNEIESRAYNSITDNEKEQILIEYVVFGERQL